jgi:membrane associated rhomboid family serine protease
MSITIILLLVCVIVSYMAFQNQTLFDKLKHWPYVESRTGEYYRMITSGFIHGSWFHLLINMFIFYEFGRVVESYFEYSFGLGMGRLLFFLLFMLTIIAADLPTFYKHKDNVYYASVGASGAVSGIIFVYILLDPWKLLYLYAIIPIPGIIAGILYLVYSSWASKNSKDFIDHDAHFFGAIFGMLFTIALQPSLIIHFIGKLINIPYF